MTSEAGMLKNDGPVRLHPDFSTLTVVPGHADITRSPELFDVTNILALGGGADVHPHVPTKVGQVGTAVFWESTGAADALPFWNTNFRCDVLLFCLSGEVRIEFKDVEGTEAYGSYTGRSGDLMLLPKDIARPDIFGQWQAADLPGNHRARSPLGRIGVGRDGRGGRQPGAQWTHDLSGIRRD